MPAPESGNSLGINNTKGKGETQSLWQPLLSPVLSFDIKLTDQVGLFDHHGPLLPVHNSRGNMLTVQYLPKSFHREEW